MPNIDSLTALIADLDNQTYDWQPNEVLSQDDVRDLLGTAWELQALKQKIGRLKDDVEAL